MDSLRVLLVDTDLTSSERLAGRLEQAHHEVLPASGLEEAAQALEIQRFDAVVVSSKLVNDELRDIRRKLNSADRRGRDIHPVPFVCYAANPSEHWTQTELDHYQVDACLPPDFEAPVFSSFVSHLATQLFTSQMVTNATTRVNQPVFRADEFQEQIAFDPDLATEIIDLFFVDSSRQVNEMQSALDTGDLARLSRTAHSIKGSLCSLYAIEAAARAQTLEQLAKNGDRPNSTLALSGLRAALADLEPELLRLRNAPAGS